MLSKKYKNYKKFIENVKPNVINIDYNIDPKKISSEVDIPVQGLDPNALLKDIDDMKKDALKYLNIFKDHPYIFNLVTVFYHKQNQTVDYLVKLVKDFKMTELHPNVKFGKTGILLINLGTPDSTILGYKKVSQGIFIR